MDILDTEFGDKRKLMDELLKEINSLKPVKSDPASLSRYAATILGFVNNMEQKRLRGHKCLRSAVCYVPASIKIRCKG